MKTAVSRLTIALLLCASSTLLAQSTLTGTRLNSAGTASPRTTIQLEEPGQVTRIRTLLSQGRNDAALELALQFAEQVEQAGQDSRQRFFAHNSLCVVYTTVRELDRAEQACTRAVEIMPGQWSGWNNRGTARYLGGDMTGAQQDFLRALQEAGDRQAIIDLLRHNLSLLDVPAPDLDP